MVNYQDLVVPPVQPRTIPTRKQRNPSDPDAQVITLSPNTLTATNRFICDVCQKGFAREQNLELHKRGHNLPWKLKHTSVKNEMKRHVYLCPEPSCNNHNRSHALRDLVGIKKHYLRKHGVKKYKCQKCSKMYAVQNDLKAHSKTCGKKLYHCNCGSTFTRRNNFTVHRDFCDSLLEEGIVTKHQSPMRTMEAGLFNSTGSTNYPSQMSSNLPQLGSQVPSFQNLDNTSSAIAPGESQLGQTNHSSVMKNPTMDSDGYQPYAEFFVPSPGQQNQHKFKTTLNTVFTTLVDSNSTNPRSMVHYNYGNGAMPHLSATELLQKAAQLGSMSYNKNATNFAQSYLGSSLFYAAGSTNSPKGGIVSDSTPCGISYTNMNELPISFNSGGVGSSILNPHNGAAYEQEDGNCGGLDCCSMKIINYEEQMLVQNTPGDLDSQRSSGGTLTRDFLGVEGDMDINVSSYEPNFPLG